MALLVESVKEKQEMGTQHKLQQIWGGEVIDAELDRLRQHMTAFHVPCIQWLSQLRPLLEENMLSVVLALDRPLATPRGCKDNSNTSEILSCQVLWQCLQYRKIRPTCITKLYKN